MKQIFLIALIALTLIAPGCSGKKAEEMYETAQFEELQKNTAHARQLYQEIVDKYPDTETAKKASKRLEALKE